MKIMAEECISAMLTRMMEERTVGAFWKCGTRVRTSPPCWTISSKPSLNWWTWKGNVNIIQPHRIFEDELCYYVEFHAVFSGSSLLQSIVSDASTTEKWIKRIFRGHLPWFGTSPSKWFNSWGHQTGECAAWVERLSPIAVQTCKEPKGLGQTASIANQVLK